MSIHKRTPSFGTMHLPAEPTVTAPDGSHVRELLSLRPGARRTLSFRRARSPVQVVTARSMKSGTSSPAAARCGGAMAVAKRWSRSTLTCPSRFRSARRSSFGRLAIHRFRRSR